MRKDRKTVTDVNQDPRPRAYKSRSNNLTKSKQEGFKSILAKRDTTRSPQTPQTRNELLQQGGIRSLIFIGPLDLPLAGDVPNIDNHKPPTSPQPPLSALPTGSGKLLCRVPLGSFLFSSFIF